MTDMPKLRDGSEWGDDGEILFGSSRVLGCACQDNDEGAMVYVVIDSDESSERDCEAYASDVLALLDANELNTTANELRDQREKALELALRFGGIDGYHHKAWVIDQMVRALTGDGYDEFVSKAKAGEDGPNTYEWSTGIAP